jgi:hypothetical protein
MPEDGDKKKKFRPWHGCFLNSGRILGFGLVKTWCHKIQIRSFARISTLNKSGGRKKRGLKTLEKGEFELRDA